MNLKTGVSRKQSTPSFPKKKTFLIPWFYRLAEINKMTALQFPAVLRNESLTYTSVKTKRAIPFYSISLACQQTNIHQKNKRNFQRSLFITCHFPAFAGKNTVSYSQISRYQKQEINLNNDLLFTKIVWRDNDVTIPF